MNTISLEHHSQPPYIEVRSYTRVNGCEKSRIIFRSADQSETLLVVEQRDVQPCAAL